MVYLEYERLKRKFKDSQEICDSIISEKEVLFQKTQPKSPMGEYEREFDKAVSVGSSGGIRINQIEEYVIALEQKQINERLSEAKAILEERKSLLMQKEDELRHSKSIYDIIYVCRVLEGMKVKEIKRITHYSEPQIYRILKNIRGKIEHDRK